MTDTSKATPRPWRLVEPHESAPGIKGSNGACVFSGGRDVFDVNCALIVKAVNSYNPERDRLARELATLQRAVHRDQKFGDKPHCARCRLARQLLKLYEEEKP